MSVQIRRRRTCRDGAHNFTNTGDGPLVLSTVYGPPDHAPGTVHRTQEEGDVAVAAGEDEPPGP